MIVYVDIEHTRIKGIDPEQWKHHLQHTLDIKYKLEELSGESCLIVHYERLTPLLVQNVGAKAVLISGNRTEFQFYEEEKLAGLRAIFREATLPTMGFCGGAQMMAETFGSKAAAIDPTEVGNMMDGDSWKERTHEYGFLPINQTQYHPFFDGLEQSFVVMEAHYWEIKQIPDGFVNYAETAVTPLQFLAHQSLPLFAVQFHPELWDETHQDGRLFLQNFFEYAKAHNRGEPTFAVT